MDKEPEIKTEWMIDPIINPKDNWELYKLLIEKEDVKINTDYNVSIK